MFITLLVNRVNDVMMAGSIIYFFKKYIHNHNCFLLEGFPLFSLQFLYLHS